MAEADKSSDGSGEQSRLQSSLSAGSSSSITPVVTTVMALAASLGHFICRWCKREIPLHQMCPTRVGVCIVDNASYIALVKRWGKSRALKAWWDGMGDAERIEWFHKQSACHPGAKRKFDDIRIAQEEQYN